MIADALRAEIERRAYALRQHHPLFLRAKAGTLGPGHLANYLASIHQLVAHTPVHLELARACSVQRGAMELADHFSDKSGEEKGHDAWAERDLVRVSAMQRGAFSPSVSPSMRALIAYIESVILSDPRHYLAYILVAEYLTVLIGPEWLELLETRCGIPRSHMTVIGNHAELDKEHTEEAFENIDDLVGDPRQLGPMREVVARSMDLFGQFCAEVVESTDRVQREHAAHAPAA